MITSLLRRMGVAIGLVGAAGIVGTGSLAWACFPQPLVTLKPQGSGPAGSEVTVEVQAVSGDIEIRWNSATGEKLASAKGPAFSTMVKVPDVPAGLYTMIVLERRADGSQGGTGRTSFQVIGAGGSTAPPTSAAVAGEGGNAAEASSSSSSGSSVPAGLAAGAVAGLLAGGGAAALVSRRRGRDSTETSTAGS